MPLGTASVTRRIPSIGVLLVADDLEAGARGERERPCVGIGRDQLALAHRLAVGIEVERVAIGFDQRPVAGEPIVRDRRAGRRRSSGGIDRSSDAGQK